MNRLLTFAAAFAIATPLFAADQPKPISNPVQQPAQGDSPLVAAAKRSGRLGKKPAVVITNETLVTTGGHFTTTTEQKPITTPIYSPAPQSQQGPQSAAAPAPALTEQQKQKKAEEDRQKVVKQLQMQYEGASLNEDGDPARQEHQMQQLQVTKPEDTGKKQ